MLILPYIGVTHLHLFRVGAEFSVEAVLFRGDQPYLLPEIAVSIYRAVLRIDRLVSCSPADE